MSKNFFDDNGKYHNVQNLTLEQIYANGYAAGYDQAQKNFAADLEKIKAEMKEEHSNHDCFYINGNNYCDHWGDLQILDKHIAELKGENNDK